MAGLPPSVESNRCAICQSAPAVYSALRSAYLCASCGPEDSPALLAGKAELELNLDRIDRCCQELTATVDALIAQLQTYRDRCLRTLQAHRTTLAADIEESVSRVQRPTGKYAKALNEFHPGDLVLFDYELESSKVEHALQGILNFGFAHPRHQPPHIVLLGAEELRIFTFASSAVSSPVALSKPIVYESGTRYTLLDDSQVFCCGGDPCKSRQQ